MTPIRIKGQNLTLAEGQPEYQPLPACYQGMPEGRMTSCWKLSVWERLRLLFTGRLYISQLTFGQPPQPILPEAQWREPVCKNCGELVSKHKHPSFTCPSKLN